MIRLGKTVYRTLTRPLRRRIRSLPWPVGSGIQKPAPTFLAEQSFKARVVRVVRETPRAVTVEFELLEGYRFNYLAGQCVTVSLPVGGVLFQRCFTLSSVPDENRYSITVQKVHNGRVSTWMNESLMPGDIFYVSHPAGGFVLPPEGNEDQSYLMVAGGSGIVPVFALIKDLLGKNPATEIGLIYYSPSASQCIFRHKLERLEKQHENFTIQFRYTHKDELTPDTARYLSAAEVTGLLHNMSHPSSTLVYLSGPQGLLRICMEGLHAAGVEESRIRIELFNRTPLSLVPMELEPHELTFLPASLLGKVRKVTQSKAETVLESAQHAGVNIPQGCTIGNCQTCKVKMEEGSVIMDEPNTLSLEDARQGYVLSCVAWPCDDVVIKLSKD